MSITGLLNVSKLGIFASQAALKITSNNIANVNTPGYARQVAKLVPNDSAKIELSGGEGVMVDEVRRQVDTMVERRVALNNQELGRLNARERFLPLVEDVFNDLDGDGLGSRMESFFEAADTLADNPSNPVGRAQLLVDGDALSRYANQMYSNLSEVALPVDQEITYMLGDINNRLKGLSEIDLAIIHQENSPAPALDLKDQRQQMIKELSGLIDIQTFENSDKGITVMTNSGKLLMERDYYASFARGNTDVTENGFEGIRLNNRLVDITGEIQSGELKGLIEVRDTIVHGTSGMLSQLETFVDEVRFRVNSIHSQSVGKSMPSTMTGAFDLGTDLTTAIASLTNADAPPDMGRVRAAAAGGAVTFAFGPDDDTLSVESISIDSSMSITDVKDAIAASTNLEATIVNNKLVITPKNGNAVMAVKSDTSNILAALGINVMFTGTGARDLKVNAQLQANHALVAASRITEKDGSYSFDDVNNAGALALGNMRSEYFSFGEFTAEAEAETHSFAGKYAAMVGDLGSIRKRNTDSTIAQQAAQSFIEDVREGVSGVSLEEELTNMIKFQRAFQASSKMVMVADELMNTLLSMVR